MSILPFWNPTGLDIHAYIGFRLVEDDFLMAREREDGHVYFVGGLVVFPGMYVPVSVSSPCFDSRGRNVLC